MKPDAFDYFMYGLITCAVAFSAYAWLAIKGVL